MKKILLILFMSVCAFSSPAQEAVEKTFGADPLNHPLTPFYVALAFIVIVIITLIIVILYLSRLLNALIQQTEKERALKSGKVYTPQPSWWDRLVQKLNASVPVTEEKNIDLGHNFDGIRELDNHLPPWWTWLFYGTIAWSVVYVIIYHFSHSMPLSTEEYQNEVTLAEEQVRKFKASQPQVEIDENTLQFSSDAAIIEKGKKVFMDYNCGSCHRNDGGGNTIGPNLTDAYWIHGGDIKNIYATIKNGFVEKGMPAWGKAMSAESVRDVSFFVMSLQGTNPPDAKAPQGEIFKNETQPATDTTKVQASLNE